MSGKLECIGGVYDNSTGWCRPYEDIDAYSDSEAGVDEAGENNERPCTAVENSRAKRYADVVGDRDNLVFHKSYWINEFGVITDTLFDVDNRRGDAVEQAWREWKWADECGKVKSDILEGAGMLWNLYAARNCFESVDLPLSSFSKVVDFYTGAVVNAGDKERRFGHNMLALDRGGQTRHAVGLLDGYIRVLDLFKKRFNRQLVGQPPPEGLLDMRVFDANNDHDTDWIEARMFPRNAFDNVSCALAIFDPIWNDESLPDFYTYAPDFTPGALQVYVKEGDEVRKGDKLFAFKGQEPYRAEVNGEVIDISYYVEGTEMGLTIDRADKGWLADNF